MLCSGFLANIWIPAAATLPCAIPDQRPANAIGKQAPNKYKPWSNGIPEAILVNTKNPITKPYKPCVPGNNSRIKALPNFSGSSVTNPVAASPTIPTPLADPIPDKPTAKATPIAANINPPLFSIKNWIHDISIL